MAARACRLSAGEEAQDRLACLLSNSISSLPRRTAFTGAEAVRRGRDEILAVTVTVMPQDPAFAGLIFGAHYTNPK